MSRCFVVIRWVPPNYSIVIVSCWEIGFMEASKRRDKHSRPYAQYWGSFVTMRDAGGCSCTSLHGFIYCNYFLVKGCHQSSWSECRHLKLQLAMCAPVQIRNMYSISKEIIIYFHGQHTVTVRIADSRSRPSPLHRSFSDLCLPLIISGRSPVPGLTN